MKKAILIVLAILLFGFNTAYAGSILDFTEDTAPTSDDMCYVINDPGGTPADRKVTIGNLAKGMSLLYLSDWPVGLDLTELSYVNGVTSAIQTQLDGKQPLDSDLTYLAGFTPTANVKSILNAADYAAIKALLDLEIGTDIQAYNSILTTLAAGGSNNTLFGKSNAGVYGFFDSFTPILTAAPASDDTYTGTITTFTAGETLAQWDVVYCKNKSGVHACYKYDADGADKAYPPRAVATTAINADASGVFLLEGIVRNDGWSMTTNQDEGKRVYASTTAGLLTLTEPSSNKIEIGQVVEQNIIQFKFDNKAPRPQKTYSIVVPSVADTDDMMFVKLPYDIKVTSLDCIVSAATSATINIVECNGTGTCTDEMATADLVCDTDGANTTTFGGAAGDTADSGDWLQLKIESISGTPGTLTVTLTYSIIGD